MTLATFATLLVSIAFTGLCVWVLWPANKTRLESYGSIPLEDDALPPRADGQPR